MKVNFYKGEVGGNDLILVEDKGLDYSKIAPIICKRHYGIGADGLLVYVDEGETFRMEFFNPDGKRVDFCGNGALLISWYGSKYKDLGEKFTFLSDIAGIRTEIMEKSVRIIYPKMLGKQKYLRIKKREGLLLDAGVPHFIMQVDDLSKINVEKIGREIAHDKAFPNGVNVDFYKIENGYIKLRTYERGVEGETLSCGSGVMAVGAYAIDEDYVENPVNVYTQGGEYLVGKEGNHLYLEGEPHIVFKGRLPLYDIIFLLPTLEMHLNQQQGQEF